MTIISLTVAEYESPIGAMVMVFCDEKLCYLDFADNRQRMEKLLGQRFGDYEIQQTASLTAVHTALDGYFEGDRKAFDNLRLNTHGTVFQQKVWKQLMRIPSGKTLDYSQLAKKSGNDHAVRAAAGSNARNPISIIIPCHRVIGKDGGLRGYAGGMERKRWLLNHEGVNI